METGNKGRALDSANSKAVIRESWHVRTLDYWRDLLDEFAGPEHGLRVTVYRVGSPDERIEITRGGRLPRQLRAGLRHARAYWEAPRKGSVSWDDAPVVWHESKDGWGPRFAIMGLGALLDLVAERRALLASSGAAGGAA